MQIDSTAIQIPTEPGTPFEGGYFVGRLRVGDRTAVLIVAPRDGGETTGVWAPDPGELDGADSFFDGAANTAAMAQAGSALATWARGLTLGGFADWYLPSRDELELLYRHLKPTTDDNWRRSGDNPSSIPVGYPYGVQTPAQTTAEPFRDDGPQALADTWYWSSTQSSRSNAWYQYFDVGSQDDFDKSFEGRARAVRRLVIE